MLIFDQFKKNDPHLRAVAVMVLCGLAVLVAGLWWVQIVSARDYQAHLEMQSFRTVRIPAVRGKILDRNGVVLAENRPAYNVSLYLDELRETVQTAYEAEIALARADLKQRAQAQEQKLHRALTKQEKRRFVLSLKDKELLQQKARYEAASNAVAQLSRKLRIPLSLDPVAFEKHSLALPYPVCTNLTAAQIAQFEEQCCGSMGVDVEMQSIRVYPHHSTAAHVIGSVRHDDSSIEGEDAFFSYRLPDYMGQIGVEKGYDKMLHGMAGVKSVVVNNVGYRQTENVWSPAEPGQNVVLTIDLAIQQKSERALQQVYGAVTRGAVVVLDVETGDILALASSPTLDPNDAVQGFPPGELERRANPRLRPEINRATQARYAPGSIFKTLVGLACLEAGLDPKAVVHNTKEILVGKRPIRDLAEVGDYNFREALMHSSNTYFISNGLSHAGIENIVKLGQRLHLGERNGLQTWQDNPGIFPDLKRVRSQWFVGDTANICIGQGQMAVTPLQMAVMTAAIANGGKVIWPRLVCRIEPPETETGGQTNIFESGRVRDNLMVSPGSLKIVCEAMFGDVNEQGGTGTRAAVPGMNICGKTGTAQVMDQNNKVVGDTTWFASFAPYEQPRYAVVVMVENEYNGGTGGGTCAPIAHSIYTAIQERNNHRTLTVAEALQ